jgi:hypothetical protein
VKNILAADAKAGLIQWQDYFLHHSQTSGASDMPVYRNNYRLGLKGWLSNTYLQLEALMGDQFLQLAEKYIDQVTLNESNMNEFERGLLITLKAEAPEFYDIGLVDLFINQSYYAANGAAFPFEHLAQLTETQQIDVQFCVAPFVFGVESYLQLDTIWHAYRQANIELARALVGGAAVIPRRFLITRIEFRPEIRRLSDAQAALFDAIQAGLTLGAISEDAQGVLPLWIQEGIVTGITSSSSSL